jgi:hypothetical protein
MELSGVSPFFSRSEILSHEAVLSNLHRELKRRLLFQGVCPAVSSFALNAPNGCQPPAAIVVLDQLYVSRMQLVN